MAHTTVSTHLVTTETSTHTIEVSDGCLTIGEHAFPENCVSLSPEDTQAVLDTLLVAQRGSEPVRLSIGESGGKTFPSLIQYVDI